MRPLPSVPPFPEAPAEAAPDRIRSLRVAAAWAAAGGILGNVLGVVFLRDVPSPYRPGDVTAWLEGSGLELRDGVVCDEHCAVLGAAGVFAGVDSFEAPGFGVAGG